MHDYWWWGWCLADYYLRLGAWCLDYDLLWSWAGSLHDDLLRLGSWLLHYHWRWFFLCSNYDL